jgi:methionine synthase II (cobalamin-independent)
VEDDEFDAGADDAVRLVVEAHRRAGVDVFTDGEQRRDNYASFVRARLDLMRTVSAGPQCQTGRLHSISAGHDR